jgi:hypothetical protein
MDPSEFKTNLDTSTQICLGYLIQKGFVTKEDLAPGWYSRFDQTDRLEANDFAAGCTFDDNGTIIITFNLNRPFDELLWAIPHESVHIAQLAKGDWDPQIGYSFWKGERYENLSGEDENYYLNQPWEAEAKSFEDELREYLENNVGGVKDQYAIVRTKLELA